MARLLTEGFEAGISQLYPINAYVESYGGGYSGNFYLNCPYANNAHDIGGFDLPEPYPAEAYIKFALRGPLNAIRLGNELGVTFFMMEVAPPAPSEQVFNYYDLLLLNVAEKGSALYTTNWTTYEFKIVLANPGQIQVRVGGQLDYVLTGVDLSAHSGLRRITFDYRSYAYGAMAIDDVIVNDTSGSQDNSWVGDRRILSILPNSNGSSSLLVGADADSVDNYQQVDEPGSDGDSTYVESSTAGDYDLYALSSPGTQPGYVPYRVIVEADARETVAEDDQYVAIGIKTNSTEDWADAVQVNTTWKNLRQEYSINPITEAAWTDSEISALEAGVKVVS